MVNAHTSVGKLLKGCISKLRLPLMQVIKSSSIYLHEYSDSVTIIYQELSLPMEQYDVIIIDPPSNKKRLEDEVIEEIVKAGVIPIE